MARDLHPLAWWGWALGLAAAASRTTNPWLLASIVAVASFVVVARRSDAPWALSFRLYLLLGALIVAVRVAFRVLFGGGDGGTVLLHLPEVPLPEWAAGIRLLGDVTAASVLGGLYDGMRLGTMVICVGAANALANPKRLLASMPPALYEVGTAVVVALSLFPQLAESVHRVRAARSLRGRTGTRLQAVRSVAIPVLEDALDRSLRLAAAMDARGYGRSGSATRRARAVSGSLMIGGLLGVCIGTYATLDSTSPRSLALPVLLLGIALALLGFRAAGARVQRTRYRPDRWRTAEVAVAASGLAAAVTLFVVGGTDPTTLHPPLLAPSWPPLTWMPLLGVLAALAPAVVAPVPESSPAALDDRPVRTTEALA